MDVDTPCVDCVVVDDPHARNVAVGKAQLDLAIQDETVADAGFAGGHTGGGGWLGRQDSNLGWRDQNPLPYRLATPQQAPKRAGAP